MLFVFPIAASGNNPHPGEEKTARSLDEDRVIHLTYDCHFDEALDMLGDSANNNIEPIEWNFFRGVVLWHELVYLDSAKADGKRVEGEFTLAISRTIKIGESALSRNPNDTMALFFTGFALGYLAKYDASKGDEFKAASDGNKGLSYHRKFLEMYAGHADSSPACSDAYFSLALFNYYTSGLSWYLKPLLFILGKSGSEEKAYEYLNLAARNGRFTKYEAEDILGELYGREDKLDSATITYRRLGSQFPDAFMYYSDKLEWMLADHRDFERCAVISRETIKSSGTHRLTQIDSLYLAKTYFRLARCYEETGDNSLAMQTLIEMIDRHITMSLTAMAHYSVATLYEHANDPKDAIREYQWVVNSGTIPDLVNQARRRLDDLGAR